MSKEGVMPKVGDPRLPRAFWDEVAADPATGCWLWTGTTAHGYGYVKADQFPEQRLSTRRAHRVSYIALIGPIPDGLDLDHVRARGCVSRACINPDHLEAVTRRTNILRGDALAAENARRETCSSGHTLDGGNLYVTPDGRRQCRTCNAERNVAYRARKRGDLVA